MVCPLFLYWQHPPELTWRSLIAVACSRSDPRSDWAAMRCARRVGSMEVPFHSLRTEIICHQRPGARYHWTVPEFLFKCLDGSEPHLIHNGASVDQTPSWMSPWRMLDGIGIWEFGVLFDVLSSKVSLEEHLIGKRRLLLFTSPGSGFNVMTDWWMQYLCMGVIQGP